ncbi:MAG: hypothetical protein M1821_006992 [Bathelium mastoideum]|nr:MAG: hypothetical protein M1821_006992 [Bathelium mastoideum]
MGTVITQGMSRLQSTDIPPWSEWQIVVFKEVDDIIHADIYDPAKPVDPDRGLPVALMILGGGHIMLSRDDIRPEQTQMLLQSGFLSISIDYKLCPEKTLVEGPIGDVADALAWSTEGTLAMSTVWTSIARGMQPQGAILALYYPIDYEDPFWTRANVPSGFETLDAADHALSYSLDEDVWAGVQDRPITSYNIPSSKRALGGWMVGSDPRSRLALYIYWHGRTLHVLLNGLDWQSRRRPQAPAPAEIQAIDPLAYICKGHYSTPTFIIHPRQDDPIP